MRIQVDYCYELLVSCGEWMAFDALITQRLYARALIKSAACKERKLSVLFLLERQKIRKLGLNYPKLTFSAMANAVCCV